MNKQKKLEAIYKEIANKELSFGCKILDNSRDTGSNTFYITESVAGGCVLIVSDEADDHCGYEHIGAEKSRKWGDFKIIGHPVMIGDVLDYCFENGIEILGRSGDKGRELISLWRETRKPIDDQPEETIDYIYNLLEGKHQ